MSKFTKFIEPKVFASFSICLLIVGWGLALYAENFEYLGLFASASGIFGALLAARKIFRKGIDEIVWEARHIDYGSTAPTSAEVEEGRQVDKDVEAQASGGLIILLSAFFVFLSQIMTF